MLLDTRRRSEPRQRQRRRRRSMPRSTCSGRRRRCYPQPRAYLQQQIGYLDLMEALLDKGADANARLDEALVHAATTSICSASTRPARRRSGAPPTRATSTAMKLLVALRRRPEHPDDRSRPAVRDRRRRPRPNARPTSSGLPPVPVGGPGVPPLHAASGVGYGEGFAGNAHRYAPDGLAGGGEVSWSRSSRRRQRPRSRRQHAAAPRRRARRQRDDSLPRVEGRRRRRPSTAAGQTTVGHGERAGAAHRSRSRRRSSCSRASARRTINRCVSC